MKLVSYIRVSTQEQGESALGLEAQTAAIEAYANTHGHTIVESFSDVASGAKRERDGLQTAMDLCKRGQAEGLIVAKVDRLTRSLLQFAEVVEAARRQGWQIVCLDIGMDMTTPSGKAMAGMLAVFAEFERSMTSARTKAAVERRRVRLGGTLPGTRPAVQESVRERLKAMRGKGMTLKAIADSLQAERVPTAQGGLWHASTVRHVLNH